MQRLAGHVGGLGRRQIDHGRGDVVGRAELLGGDVLLDPAVCFSLSASVMGVEMNPGAMQFTVMPREATSRASDFDMAMMPALEAE